MDWRGSVEKREGDCNSLWNYLNSMDSFMMDIREVLENTGIEDHAMSLKVLPNLA